jgi:hypothetical protein
MDLQRTAPSARKSKLAEGLRELRLKLADILGTSPEEITPSQFLVALIPSQVRRRVWRQLQEEGVGLPDLRLSQPVVVAAAIAVLIPLTVLAAVRKSWLVYLGLFELGWLARKLTRPWAIYPPNGCETVLEAVLHVTPFRGDDYRAGLWSRDDIATKVRWIFSKQLGIPFAAIKDDTPIADIWG